MLIYSTATEQTMQANAISFCSILIVFQKVTTPYFEFMIL